MLLFGRSGPLWMTDPQRKQLRALGKRVKSKGLWGTSQGDVGAVSIMLLIKVSSAIRLASYLSVARTTGCTTTTGWLSCHLLQQLEVGGQQAPQEIICMTQ